MKGRKKIAPAHHALAAFVRPCTALDMKFLLAPWLPRAVRNIAEFSLAEQKPQHVLLDDRDTGRVGSAQTVVIDQDREMRQPALPGFARDIFENALTERAWMGRKVETFGLALQHMAKDST